MRRERYKNSKQQQTNICITWGKGVWLGHSKDQYQEQRLKVAVSDRDMFAGNVSFSE